MNTLPPTNIAKRFQKIVAAFLIAAMNWNGLYAVGVTGSYFIDNENSASNFFKADILDIVKSETPWSVQGLNPGMTATRTVTISKPADSISFEYEVSVSALAGELCSSLTLTASRNNEQVYNGAVSGFLVPAAAYSGAPETWRFDATLADNDSDLMGESCSFSFIYSASQTIGGGFFDSETVLNNIGAGSSWSGNWVQTSANDFSGDAVNNTVVFDGDGNGDAGDEAGTVRLATQTAGSEQVGQFQNGSNESYTVRTRSSAQNWGAQTFTADKTGKLKKVSLRLKKNSGNSTPAFVVEIKKAVDGKPDSNAALGSITKPAGEFSTNEDNYDFDFSSQNIAITSGSQYAIVVHEATFADWDSRYYSAFYQNQDNTDPYAGGGKLTSTNGGLAWTESSGQTCETVCDLWFLWCWESHQECTDNYQDFRFSATVQTEDTYYESGTLTSATYDSNMMSRWDSLSWNEALNGGNITFRVATANDTNQWSEWQPLVEDPENTISLSSLPELPESRYIRWEVTLVSDAAHTATPLLNDVTVSYRASLAGSSIKLNEFLPEPSSGNEWVELYNKGTAAVDLNGWQIKTADGSTSATIGTGAVLQPNDWYVAYLSGNALGNISGGIELYDPLGNKVDFYNYDLCDSGAITKTPDSTNGVNLPNAGTCESGIPTDKSYARIPDGTGPWYDPIPTPGVTNELSDEEMDALNATTTEEIIITETIDEQLEEFFEEMEITERETGNDAGQPEDGDGGENYAVEIESGDDTNASSTAEIEITEPDTAGEAAGQDDAEQPVTEAAENEPQTDAGKTGGDNKEVLGQISFEENSDAVLAGIADDDDNSGEPAEANPDAESGEPAAIPQEGDSPATEPQNDEGNPDADVPATEPDLGGGGEPAAAE